MFSQGIGFQSVYSTPGGGGTQTLQTITTNGNETNKSIILVDEFGNKIRVASGDGQFLVFKIIDDTETPIANFNADGITFSNFLEQFILSKEAGGSSQYKFPNNTFIELVASREWTVLQLENKADLVGGKIPASQIPSGFDEIVEYATFTAFPVIGESNIYYVALDTNKTFRWGGSNYVVMNDGLALGETSSTAYRGDRGKTAYDHSQLFGSNPHGTTAAQVGAYTQAQVDLLLGGKINLNTWVDYSSTSTILGWVSFTSKIIRYLDCGNFIVYYIYLSGASNLADVSFSIHYTLTTGLNRVGGFFSVNNGAFLAGLAPASISSNSNIVSVPVAQNSGTSWLNSGTKSISGIIIIPKQ